MYGVAKAGVLAKKLLSSRLEREGYYQCQFTPSLWRHTWRPITFTLVMDDFGVKFEGDCHDNHLKKCLEKHYEVSIDWSGSLFCGIHLDCNYEKGYVNTSMPGYIDKAHHKYQHPMPKRPVNAPAKFKPIQYGAKVQIADVDPHRPNYQKSAYVTFKTLSARSSTTPEQLILHSLPHSSKSPHVSQLQLKKLPP